MGEQVRDWRKSNVEARSAERRTGSGGGDNSDFQFRFNELEAVMKHPGSDVQ